MSVTILVVDDEPALSETIADVLSDAGYRVAVASNGREALDYLRANEAPALILLDLMMPVLDGYEFRDEQRADPRLAQIPTVVVTAGTLSDRVKKLDAVACLTKPVGLKKLLDVVAEKAR